MSWLVTYYGFWILPASLWLVNQFLRNRIRWSLLWLVAIFGCYGVLLLAVHLLDFQLQAELNQHDLNGDGVFSGAEITPDMELAMGRLTCDTGRTFAPITGIPFSIIWVAMNYIPLGLVSLAIWRIRAHRGDFDENMQPNGIAPIPWVLKVTTVIHTDLLAQCLEKRTDKAIGMKMHIKLIFLFVFLLIGCDGTSPPSAPTLPGKPTKVERLFYESRYEEAIAEAEADVLRTEQRYGSNSAEAASYRNTLGNLYRECGRLSDAERAYEQTLEIRKKLFGNDHPYTAETLNGLGALYELQNRIEEAEALYEESLRIRKEALGLKNEHTAVSLSNLGLLLQSKGQLDRAEEYLKQSLSISEETLASNHPELALAYFNLSGLEYQRSNFSHAESYCQRALKIQLETLRETDSRVIKTLDALATISDKLEKLEAAREYRARANPNRSTN